MKNNKAISCLTEDIIISPYYQFPSETHAYSSNIENSIISIIKLYSPLKEIIDDKCIGIKKSYPHRLYYTKILAFSFVEHYEDINVDEYDYKLFPQTNINIVFYGKKINITTEGNLKFNVDPKNYSYFLNYINGANYYKVIINQKNYLFIVKINNHIEIDGALKAEKDFDLLDIFKCHLLYIKKQNFVHNFMDNNNNNFHFSIKNDNILIFDVKSTFCVSDLITQVNFHDGVLFNLFNSCGENLSKYFYVCILSDKNKTKEKENKLKLFLKKNQIKSIYSSDGKFNDLWK